MKNLTGWAALLLAAMTLNSCSQDAELEAAQETAATTGALTPEQKAQIMELATSYGLNFSFVTLPKVRSSMSSTENVDSMTSFVKAVANCMGDYPLVSHTEQEAVFARGENHAASPQRLSRGFMEGWSGSFVDMEVGPYGSPMIVTVSWMVGPTQPGSVSISIDFNGSDLMSAGANVSSEFYGLNAFTFKGVIRFYYGSGLISLEVSGGYSNGMGYVSVG